MKNLTQDERTQIAIEEMRDHPMDTIAIVAICKIAESGIRANSENVVFKTEATIDGKRYKLKSITTYKEI